jgi:hypothetical protein
MSLAASSTAPRMTLDKTPCNNIGKAEDQSCNVTDDNLKTDCYESMHAFKKIRTSTSGLRKSPNKWTKEENQKLAALVAHYGEKKWKRISAEMGGQKTGAQCAQHWKRVLSPEIRKGHWDENEEDLLLRLVVQYGSCWKKIAKKIPQRTDIQCRYQYLKAKQSREVKWDAKEDESLIKKVMEMANCTFFKFVNDGSTCTTINSYDTPTNGYANSLAGSTNSMTSPMSLSSVINNNKENENDNHARNGFRLSSSVNSDLSDDRSSLRSSGGSSSGGGSGSETDTKDTDVSMSDGTSDLRSSSSSISGIMMEKDGASYHPAPTTSAPFNNNLGMAMHKVVWLEIAEHMARMKLTSTLRTALECKTRFLELVGNISVSGSPTNGQDSKPFDLKSSGGINAPSETRNAASSHSSPSFLHRTPSGGTSPNDTNINININNASDHNNNHISITNFSRNITINITNSPTNSTRSPHNSNSNSTNNAYNPRPHSSPSHPHTNPNNINGTIVKTESTSSSMETSPTTSTRTSTSTTPPTSASSSTNNNNMPNAPSFPSFPHFSPVAQPLAATAKPARSNSNSNINSNSNSNTSNNNGNVLMNMNGLDSLAAVASILPREMLADYAQF